MPQLPIYKMGMMMRINIKFRGVNTKHVELCQEHCQCSGNVNYYLSYKLLGKTSDEFFQFESNLDTFSVLKDICLTWLQFLFLNFLCYSSAWKLVWQHYPVMKYFFLVQIWKWYIPSCSFKLKQKFQYQIWIWRSFPPSKWTVRIYS